MRGSIAIKAKLQSGGPVISTKHGDSHLPITWGEFTLAWRNLCLTQLPLFDKANAMHIRLVREDQVKLKDSTVAAIAYRLSEKSTCATWLCYLMREITVAPIL